MTWGDMLSPGFPGERCRRVASFRFGEARRLGVDGFQSPLPGVEMKPVKNYRVP
jgi:hypothetical protein